MSYRLLYKELRLTAHPNLFIFSLMGPLILVPAYPYTMIFIFNCIGVYVSFMYGRETNDIYYSALLPIEKSQVVLGKFLVVVVMQMATILISLPFALLKLLFLKGTNPVGLNANISFYALGLLLFAIFNLIFLTSFFKTAYKAGWAFLKALIPLILVDLIAEILVHFPILRGLNGITPDSMIKQLPLLVVALICYGTLTWISYRKSVQLFEQVNL